MTNRSDDRSDITKEILEDCLKRGLSQMEIAIELDASQATIHKKIKKYGLKLEHPVKKYDEEQMIRYLRQGLTMREIGERLGVHYATVSKWIKEYDLDKYRPPRTHKSNVYECRTCIYRERNGGTSGKCNYLTMTGHSRNMGQPEEKCSKYVKGKRGRKSGKRKV